MGGLAAGVGVGPAFTLTGVLPLVGAMVLRTRIRVDMLGREGKERTTYWCPRCQPEA